MAKRFGRNQRRRLRESLATAQAESQRWMEAYRLNVPMLEQRLAKARRELDYIKDAAAGMAETRLLPATVVKASQWPARWDVSSGAALAPEFAGGPGLVPEKLAMQMVDLYAVGATIETDPSRAAQAVHFFCEGTGRLQGEWRYMVSDQALLSCGLSPDARYGFVQALADRLFKAVDLHFRGLRR
jgi:hypothetical protein